MITDAAIIRGMSRDISKPQEDRGSVECRLPVVLKGVAEVLGPSLFGELIIALTFLPILGLVGMEGKMFGPLALTIMMALFVSLLLSFTLSPVLCLLLLRGDSDSDPFLVRWTKKGYRPMLEWAFAHRPLLLIIAGLMLAGSLALFPFLGGEFIPTLNEVAITPQTIRHPSISLEESIQIENAAGVLGTSHQSGLKIGRSEIGNDPQEPNASDPSSRSNQWNGPRRRPNRNWIKPCANASKRFPEPRSC